ncbi:KilA-N domain-containing protein [Halomonas sp. SH5A2]|uniref:KilA-N domain-containing protein n=1 Tax=Halomonas sp. SH5A2 TaxID=2749040 RepID=UPI001F0A2CA5|nr:KilA-N domain-containing protein [Halomonas sp. SH5A2]
MRQDDAGRYNLNDLHKAAGGDPNNAPSQWMRNKEFDQLKAEVIHQNRCANLHISPANSIRGGPSQGTFVVKELVYAYAMWISPKFNLKVIRAYDQLQTDGVAVAENAAEDLLENPLPYMEKLLGQAKQYKAERDQAVEKKTSLTSHLLNLFPGLNSPCPAVRSLKWS